MIKNILFGLIVVGAVNTSVLAQQASDQEKDRLWVTDQLRLSLYQNSNSQSKVLRYLSSGDMLEVEQLAGAYAYVSLTDGAQGWVKRGFLVSKPTSNLKLLVEKKKTSALQAEIDKLSNSKMIIDQYEEDMDGLVQKLDNLEQQNQTATELIGSLQTQLESKERQVEMAADNTTPAHLILLQTFLSHWQMIVPALLGLALLIYIISKLIVESRIKSKFHGIKIW